MAKLGFVRFARAAEGCVLGIIIGGLTAMLYYNITVFPLCN